MYKLSGKHDKTHIRVSVDYLFPTKEIAIKSFICTHEKNNGTNELMPLYYPTKGYNFTISLPENISLCPYYPSACYYKNYIIFDSMVVYGIDSKKFFDAHEYIRNVQLIVGICVLIIGICIIPIIWWHCILKYYFT